MATKIVPNEEKLRQLILYIARKSEDDETFGKVKLNKLLFLADFLAYGQYEVPITGVEYMKQEHGPVPRRMKPVQEAMIAEHAIVEREEDIGMSRPKARIFAIAAPNLDIFTAKEIALVDGLVEWFRGKSGTHMEKLTHRQKPYLVARELGDTIPYSAVFLSDESITPYEIQHAKELIAKHGWNV